MHALDAVRLWPGILHHRFDLDRRLVRSAGIGGVALYVERRAAIEFRREDGGTERVEAPVRVGRPVLGEPATFRLPLLGRDLLQRYTLVVGPSDVYMERDDPTGAVR